jgi:hypothetical protein
MSHSPNDLPPEDQDPLLELLRENRPETPPGLPERLAEQITRAASPEQRFWFELEHTARRALVASAAAALLAGGLTLWSQPTQPPERAVAGSPQPSAVKQGTPEGDLASPADELAVAGPDAALNSTLQGYWLLGEGE